MRYGLNRSILPIKEESSNEYDNDSTEHKLSQVILSKESKSFLKKQLSNLNVRVTKLSSFSYDSPKRKFLRPKLSNKSESFVNINQTRPPSPCTKRIVSSKSVVELNKDTISYISKQNACQKQHHSIIMNSKSSKTLTTIQPIFARFQKHSEKMSKNIREGSMNINTPTKFYEKIFDQWTLSDQLKRIKMLYKRISSLDKNN